MILPPRRVVRCQPKTHPCPEVWPTRPPQTHLPSSYPLPGSPPGGVARRLLRRIQGDLPLLQVFSLLAPRRALQVRLRREVREAVLDRILEDGLNVQRTLESMWRDFGLKLSQGFVYDCLRWRIKQLDMAPHRQMVLEKFSGTLCVDELHLGRFTLLLATDPVSDIPVGFALVGRNDQCRWPPGSSKNLKTGGWSRRWSSPTARPCTPPCCPSCGRRARHQLCVFHILKDVNALVLRAVRRLARAMARRGCSGRKRKRGRPSKWQQASRQARGPGNKEMAAFIMKHRFLIVKNDGDLSEQQRADLRQMFGYLPQLQTLWQFATEASGLFDPEARGSIRCGKSARRCWGSRGTRKSPS